MTYETELVALVDHLVGYCVAHPTYAAMRRATWKHLRVNAGRRLSREHTGISAVAADMAFGLQDSYVEALALLKTSTAKNLFPRLSPELQSFMAQSADGGDAEAFLARIMVSSIR